MISMIILAALVLVVIGFIAGVLCGRATGWHEGYAAASQPGEEVPADVSPFTRDQRTTRSIEARTGHHP